MVRWERLREEKVWAFIYMCIHYFFIKMISYYTYCFVTQVFNLAILKGHLAYQYLHLLYSFSYMDSILCTFRSLLKNINDINLINTPRIYNMSEYIFYSKTGLGCLQKEKMG